MPQYKYTVRDTTGNIRVGASVSKSQKLLRQMLQEQGFQVTDVQFYSAIDKRGRGRSFHIRPEEMFCFWLPFSTMLDLETPVLLAWENATDYIVNPMFKNALWDIRAEVSGGKTLSQAIQAYPNLFNPLCVNMIRAGEVSGALNVAVKRVANLLEKEVEARRNTQNLWKYLLLNVAVVTILVLLLRR